MLRRSELRAVPMADRSSEPGYRQWHAGIWGCCAICGERGRLVRHHVVLEQHLRALDLPCWDLRNSLLLGLHCRCHSAHHLAARRIPVSKLPPEAIEYAIEVFGAEQADAYFDRYYMAA